MQQTLSSEEAKQQILLLFDGYMRRKNNKTLYQHQDLTPVVILKTYFGFVEKRNYDDIFDSFRKKYIYNENKNEDVHERCEQLGLGVMYDYIFNSNNNNSFSIYTLLELHIKLYSKAPYPEAGGKFRNDARYLPSTGINLVDWTDIPALFSELYGPVNKLIKRGIELRNSKDATKILEYIDDCIKLKCVLIKIHPFMDGNGRSIRAFINLLFKLANIPPVYIKVNERTEYHKAMNKANGENDYSDIFTFYYYKICDSILELDINTKEFEEKEQNKKL